MVRDASSHSGSSGSDYVVRAPQPGDVLAGSLRAAYRGEKGLPKDMARLLSQLGGSEH